MPDLAKRTEFGDFQTPSDLANEICQLLIKNGEDPRSILEPTCGQGSFLREAATEFPHASLTGIEINGQYVVDAKIALQEIGVRDIRVLHQDIFNERKPSQFK